MSDVVIRVENLCKEYRLGTISHGTLYKDIQSGWAKLRGIEDPNARIGAVNREQLNNTNDRFSALKNVSFDVRQGEIVGIIGRNGAGKSTLLKIISRVTAPTSGTIKIKGRVASLLEVGTGFHPELTGRENIFLNGAILGMHKGEIEQKFDEIVAFSEIDKFIDTPVKRYSSGMYVRLAFAVAAHLDPEILVVDEVLAVGDAQFQKKCLGKMGDISKEGRTVLFVSHNMAAIESLCSKVIMISEGKISELGSPHEIIQKYLNTVNQSEDMPLIERKDRKGLGMIKLIEITFRNKNHSNSYTLGDDININLKIINLYSYAINIRVALTINTIINNINEQMLISCDSNLKGETFKVPGDSEITFICKVFAPPLNYGNYFVNVAIFQGATAEDWIRTAAKFSIESGVFDNQTTSSPFPILAKFEWSLKK